MKKIIFKTEKTIKLIIRILILLLLLEFIVFFSLSAPDLLVLIQWLSNICITQKSVPIYKVEGEFVLAIINFIATTVLSYLVYKLSKESAKMEKRQAVFNVIAYFEISLDSIENYNNKVVGDINLYPLSTEIYADLIKIHLKKDDFELMKEYYRKIEKIRVSQEKDNLSNLCASVTSEENYLKLKEIIEKLKKTYK